MRGTGVLCADRGDDAFYNGKCYAVTADRCHKYAIGSRSYWVCADYNTIMLIFKANIALRSESLRLIVNSYVPPGTRIKISSALFTF